MNTFVYEQLKVQEMLERINPDKKANYDSMMQVLQKANPSIISGKVSTTFKRIMYLQLIAQSIKDSCSNIESMAYNKTKSEEIREFQKSVEDFCKGFAVGEVIITDQESFEHNQRIASQLFIHKWREVSQSLSFYSGQESYAFVQ
jgi:hypothetical protein